MADLHATLSDLLCNRYAANLARVRELAAPVTEKQFWTKPYPYGNSFGHLVLHQLNPAKPYPSKTLGR